MSKGYYNDLEYKNKDTLYFVLNNLASKTGELYLGKKLISNSLSQDKIVNSLETIKENQKKVLIPSIKLLENYISIQGIKEEVEKELNKQIVFDALDGGELD